jgi:NO-binding membrane sensor protein with MHYT domain
MGGVAIWSMHYIGNRAIILYNGEVESLVYTPLYAVVSFFVPVLVLLFAFYLMRTGNMCIRRLLLGGSLAGSAICGMHYLVRFIQYD